MAGVTNAAPTEQGNITDFVSLSHRLADMARPVARRYFRKVLDVEIKNNFSPVTKADREIEALLRAEIEAVYPSHGIFGEEQGGSFDRAYTWVVDPIDGTKSFVTGVPMFGTLISRYRSSPCPVMRPAG
jgi:inositol-phosphate phosphatase / L-galactose 1-phosphate phosphatase / histidinol-phosphatase